MKIIKFIFLMIFLTFPTLVLSQQAIHCFNSSVFNNKKIHTSIQHTLSPSVIQTYKNGSGLKYQGVTGVPAGSKLY